jgi:photosystem II stability/assembly factor-like uncharacterized protein
MNRLLHSAGIIALLAFSVSAQTWTAISTTLLAGLGSQAWPGGCSGIAVNRLNGDVLMGVLWDGLYKSNNMGQSWTRVDNNYFTGTCNNAWSLQVDQNDPTRVAVFSLDGSGCFCSDGKTYKKINILGRGWDFGSVDWSTPDAKVMLVPQHESGGLVFKTTDGGVTWNQLSTSVTATGGGTSASAMVGVIDATTFVCCNGSGISRSSDAGSSWTKVSTMNPQSHVPVQFKGTFYLGTASGLLVSKDKGLTWQTQGASLNIYQGPFFGTDENTMVVAGSGGIYKSVNAGAAWTKIAAVHANLETSFTFNPSWFGCYTWDPVNNVVYTAAMGTANPAFKAELAASGVNNKRLATHQKSAYAARAVRLYDMRGQMVGTSAKVPAGSVKIVTSGRLIVVTRALD